MRHRTLWVLQSTCSSQEVSACLSAGQARKKLHPAWEEIPNDLVVFWDQVDLPNWKGHPLDTRSSAAGQKPLQGVADISCLEKLKMVAAASEVGGCQGGLQALQRGQDLIMPAKA